MADQLTYSISMARKVNTGNYTSADVYECLSGITQDTTPEEMDALLEKQGALAYAKLRAALARKVAEIDGETWDKLRQEAEAEMSKPLTIPVGAPEKQFAGRTANGTR